MKLTPFKKPKTEYPSQQVGFETPIRFLKGVGPKMSAKLKKLKIENISDLLHYFPSYYKDYSVIKKIKELNSGEVVTIKGKVLDFKNSYLPGKRTLQKATISDSTGIIEATWFNQPFLRNTIKKGAKIYFSGKIKSTAGRLFMNSPEYEPFGSKTLNTAGLIAQYPETKGVNSKYLRKIINLTLDLYANNIKETLPKSILNKYDLISKKECIAQIHLPKTLDQADKAKQRAAFEEMFVLQLKILKKKLLWKKKLKGYGQKVFSQKISQLQASLSFTLTTDQQKSLEEILSDLEKNIPMNRLLQGDVGSGKTIVALLACYNTYLNNLKSVYMAPTEILAFQHYQTFKKILSPLGLTIEINTSNKKEISSKGKQADIIIGTHALLHKKAEAASLIIIDEQHRFGVAQRAKILKIFKNKKITPHLLTMTATPIPRTISLTLQGDLDMSILKTMPKGRQKISTYVVPRNKREKGYEWIKREISKNKCQAFIVCPLIEESSSETLKSVKAAKQEYENLKKIFADFNLGLLHGKIKSTEKEEILKNMQKGKIDILVSTPVVEVGIDLPNASIMLIEAADRFGLAQLHQLRGRVGRGSLKSYCFLFSENFGQKAIKRLKALEKEQSGIKLAQMDLEMRGPGEIYGLQQHGFPELQASSLLDYPLIKKTRQEAQELLATDPELKKHNILKEIIAGNELLIAPN